MAGLTPQQDQALRFIDAQTISPSYAEIAAHLGLASKGGVKRIVSALEERGFLRRLPNRSRSLTVISRVPSAADLRRLSDADLATLADRVDAECMRRAG